MGGQGMRQGVASGAALVGVWGAVLALGGCAQPPRGDTGGRVDVTRTTPAERNDPQVLPAALFEFSDAVSQQLVADLRTIPELNTGSRIKVVFGDIVNKTGIVPTSDFEAFRTRIRGSLMQSGRVRETTRFVEMRQRMDDLIRRETGRAATEQANREGRYVERKDLDPASTYFLNGEMYRVDRGNDRVNVYMLNFTLTKMDDGTIIWQNSPYEVKQQRGW